MKIARLASLMLAAILAVSLAVSSVASAAPLIGPVGATLTGTSGTGILTAANETVTCAKDTSTGTITSSTLIGGIRVHFLECTAKNAAGATCPVMSIGAPLSNLLLTNVLHGVLGLILPKPAGSGSDIALVLLPVSGSSFLNILGTCFTNISVSGQIAGLVEPVNISSTTGRLVFGVTGGVQNITDVDLSTGGLIKPKLSVGTELGTEETTEEITFSAPVEVM